MGAYQMLGSVLINLPGHENVTDYRRDFDIGDALAHVSYSAGGVKFSREFFCSHADGVLVIHLTAGKPGSYSGSIELSDSHGAQIVSQGNHFTAAGALTNGLKYETQLIAVNHGGSLRQTVRRWRSQTATASRSSSPRARIMPWTARRIIAAKIRTRASAAKSKKPPRKIMTLSKPRTKRIFIRSSTASLSIWENLRRNKSRCPATSAKSKPPKWLIPDWNNYFSNMAATF